MKFPENEQVAIPNLMLNDAAICLGRMTNTFCILNFR